MLIWFALTHASMDSDNHPITLCLLCSQSPPKAYNVLRTFHSPSESISPMDVRFCFVVLGTTPQSATRLEQNIAFSWSYGLWVMGYSVLAIGYERFVIGNGWLGWSVRLYHKLSPCALRRNLINLWPAGPPYKGRSHSSPKSIAFRYRSLRSPAILTLSLWT